MAQSVSHTPRRAADRELLAITKLVAALFSGLDSPLGDRARAAVRAAEGRAA